MPASSGENEVVEQLAWSADVAGGQDRQGLGAGEADHVGRAVPLDGLELHHGIVAGGHTHGPNRISHGICAMANSAPAAPSRTATCSSPPAA